MTTLACTAVKRTGRARTGYRAHTMPGPRLLAVTPVTAPGGAEIHLLRLLDGLVQRGWRITLTSPGPGPLRDAALERGWAWERLALGGLGGRRGARAVLSMPRARRLAHDNDVVYLNGTVCGRLLPALPDVRTVLHVHDMVSRTPRHWRRASVVLADSRAVAAALSGLVAEVVYGPVDLDPPPADPPWGPGPGPVVGFVGRIEPRKGPLDLVHAAPLIRRAVPDARVVLVGDDPYGADPQYLARVRASRDVEHHGWVADARGLMRHLDVLVLPSYAEPFGTVLSEAMAVGTPVVATHVDGLPEVVEDGVTGALVEPGSPEELAAAVVRVLAARDEMGAAAAVSARRFATEAYVDRVAALIAPPGHGEAAPAAEALAR
jgi:glycosyltransferase involved in cell wall biosynthesis